MKELPQLDSDEEAGLFIADFNLTEYDLSGMRLVQFAFEPKGVSANSRDSAPLQG